MLDVLERVERELPILLLDAEGWTGLFIDYHPPTVERLWRKWGAYLSERQWGTVREDYSPYGNAWEYLPHDHARSRAYRWGEDGIAGFSDHHQRLCLALVFWNGRDPRQSW